LIGVRTIVAARRYYPFNIARVFGDDSEAVMLLGASTFIVLVGALGQDAVPAGAAYGTRGEEHDDA
jgi:hypothetical protein